MKKDVKKGSSPVFRSNIAPDNTAFQQNEGKVGQKAGHKSATMADLFEDALQAKFFNQKISNEMACTYKNAKLSSSNPKDWFIYYYYMHPVTLKMVRFKERFNMNRIADMQERKAFAMEAIRFVNDKLKKGFNPFETARPNKPQDTNVLARCNDIVAHLALTATVPQGKTYTCMLGRLRKFVQDRKLDDVPFAMWTHDLCTDMQQWMKHKGLSTKTNNTTISHLGLFWDVAISHKLCEHNPWRRVKKLRKAANTDEDVFAPITFDEMKKIFAFLRERKMFGFIRFLAFIYYAWARPVEICRLRVRDIDLQNNLIFFRSSETKNGRSASVQIVPKLRDYIEEMELHKYPGEWFLFNNKTYAPGPDMRTANNAGKTWVRMVHNHLGIIKAMYALKHTGNVDYLMNNIGHVDRTWQQMQNRHSSAAMTERYCRKLNAYFLDVKKIRFFDF